MNGRFQIIGPPPSTEARCQVIYGPSYPVSVGIGFNEVLGYAQGVSTATKRRTPPSSSKKFTQPWPLFLCHRGTT